MFKDYEELECLRSSKARLNRPLNNCNKNTATYSGLTNKQSRWQLDKSHTLKNSKPEYLQKSTLLKYEIFKDKKQYEFLCIMSLMGVKIPRD